MVMNIAARNDSGACVLVSIVETETAWKTFSDECAIVDAKLSSVDRELSCLKVNEMTFQQMHDSLRVLKVSCRTSLFVFSS